MDMTLDCTELRALADEYPQEMAVIVEMMIEAEEEICDEAA